MKIDRPFNTLTKSEYLHYIENYKKYTDFNTLGLYRSLLENEHLAVSEKVEIRDFAHSYFQKTFDFLVLKDPVTFIEVTHIDQELTKQEYRDYWEKVKEMQEKLIKDKKLGHRNFGTYSKHDCGYDDCPYNGVMIKKGSVLEEMGMCFASDKNADSAKQKSKRLKREQREWKQKRF